MAETIKCVVGDSKPNVTVTLTDKSTNAAFDLSAGTTTVNVLFRAVGSTTLLSTISGTITDGANGIFTFDFSGGVLDGLSAGLYEGEIEVDLNGAKHTVFDPLKFRVRDDFN